MIKCCIFDLDGTLLNTIPSITHYINKTFREEGFSEICESDTVRFIGNGASKLIERSLKRVGSYSEETHKRVLKRYNSLYDTDPYYLTEPYGGIFELLSELRNHGIKLAVLSNKPDSTTKLCVSHFFGDSFDFVMGGRDDLPLKPSPDSTFEMLRALFALPSETVFIGDSDVDIITGKNAGVALTLGAVWGFRGREELSLVGADILADNPSDAKRALMERL